MELDWRSVVVGAVSVGVLSCALWTTLLSLKYFGELEIGNKKLHDVMRWCNEYDNYYGLRDKAKQLLEKGYLSHFDYWMLYQIVQEAERNRRLNRKMVDRDEAVRRIKEQREGIIKSIRRDA